MCRHLPFDIAHIHLRVPDRLSRAAPFSSKEARTFFSIEQPRQSKAFMHSVDSITPALLQMHSSFGIENTTGRPSVFDLLRP